MAFKTNLRLVLYFRQKKILTFLVKSPFSPNSSLTIPMISSIESLDVSIFTAGTLWSVPLAFSKLPAQTPKNLLSSVET